MRINQNVMALNAYRNLSATSNQLGKSLEKLSSGSRINRAGDDAAGLVISQKLRAQLSGLNQAVRNAQDGISVVQTAEGALTEVHSMLTRMRELAVQAANGGANDANARQAAQDEVDELASEVTRIAQSTTFGTTNLLDGTYGSRFVAASTAAFAGPVTVAAESFDVIVGATTVTVNIGAGNYDTASEFASAVNQSMKAALIGGGLNGDEVAAEVNANGEISLASSGAFSVDDTSGLLALAGGPGTGAAAAQNGGDFQVGANANEKITVSISSMTAASLGVGALDLTTSANASNAITTIDAAIDSVSTQRETLGSQQNRFESIVSNLAVTVENLSASESRIRDTDMAKEMAQFTKNQILSQAGTAMLAQANSVPQAVLRLLQ